MCAAVKTFRIGKFDLNPRGNLWAKDENKFGQKLLSKMGWSEGKGLGKNENGITESIKVRMKIGHTGVGFVEKVPLGLESHEYEAVLESLNNKFKTSAVTKTENNLKGLEQRSHQFKNRLHYQKFVRGKDVGRYSEKDMNSIFVTRKTQAEPPAVVPVKSTVTNVDSNPSENAPPESMPTFKSQMSMNDYFTMKLKKKSGELSKQSLLCNEETPDSEDCSTKEDVSNKKRKRELKNSSKHSKKFKLLQSEDSETVQAASAIKVSDEIKTELLSEGETSPVIKKEKKNKNSKLGEKLINLKSCLKNTFSTNLWFKQDKKEVSFNDSISYKIIENVLNGKTAGLSNNEIDDYSSMDCFEDYDMVDEEKCVVDNKTNGVEEVSDIEYSSHLSNNLTSNEAEECKNESFTELEEGEIVQQSDEDLGIPKCFELPKCDKSNFNTWLESQRIATKMKVYKNMAKKFRKNPVLKTSNLLDIKGYGNWGL